MLKKIRAKMQDRKGFTLIELMIVIAILGVLAAVAIPYYNQYIENSKMRIARSNYDSAVRTVKAEFSNITAGNPATLDLVNVLNDGNRNRNPFNPANPAFIFAATSPNRGQVWVSRTSFTGLQINDPVTVGCQVEAAPAPARSEVLTFQ